MEARFSAPVQTGPGAHPASCTMGTGSFPGVKNGRGVTLTPHPLLVPWSRKSKLYLYFPYGPTACTEPLPVQGCTSPYLYCAPKMFDTKLAMLLSIRQGHHRCWGYTKRAICDTCLFSGNAQKAPYYYTAQINSCSFTAYQCNRICCENLRQRGVCITVY